MTRKLKHEIRTLIRDVRDPANLDNAIFAACVSMAVTLMVYAPVVLHL